MLVILMGCAVKPVPLERAERDALAAESQQQLFVRQEPIRAPLSLSDASARAVKYHAETRVRLMEQAAALGQLEVAQFDLLPKLTANAGYSTRSNEAFGFGFTPGGTIAANPSASSERSHTTASLGFTWNVLDFGVSYFRAKQLADQSLIAEERRRKALQNLMQDVRLAWWRAEAAQRLLPLIDALFEEIDQTVEKTRVIEARKLLPPLQTASLRRALLDMKQQVSVRRQELEQAKLELTALVNAPPGTDIRIVPAKDAAAANVDLATSFEALESFALRNRPELAEEAYKARIGESEAKKGLLALFPNFNLDAAYNYDSNRFLVNNSWASLGLGVAYNLLRAFSRPAVERSNEAQRELDEARRLATAMAILTQTRMAAVRFGLLSQEFEVWDEATTDDEQIVKFLSASTQVGIDTELELVRAKARFLISKVTRDLVYANLEAALGRIFHSVGMDALPETVSSHDTSELARVLQTRIEDWQKVNFQARPAPEKLAVLIGDIVGLPAEARQPFRASLQRILELSGLNVVEGEPENAGPRMSVITGVVVEPLRNGGRPVVIRVRLLDVRTGAVRFSSEFRTTLSEPVDQDQWQTLGEAAAYRVAAPLGRMQSTRAEPRRSAQVPAVAAGKPPLTAVTSPPAPIPPVAREPRLAPAVMAGPTRLPVLADGTEALVLKLDQQLTWPQVDSLTRAEDIDARIH